ncbi:MAG: hypothetical protein V3R91_09330 [Myxococcota bacterium]
MAGLKTGARLRSAVCTTEVMVISVPDKPAEIACGGAPMIDVAEAPPGDQSPSPDAAEGTKLGKRYVDDSGDLELLCTKAGDGSLATGGVLLKLKEAKKLPSSD